MQTCVETVCLECSQRVTQWSTAYIYSRYTQSTMGNSTCQLMDLSKLRMLRQHLALAPSEAALAAEGGGREGWEKSSRRSEHSFRRKKTHQFLGCAELADSRCSWRTCSPKRCTGCTGSFQRAGEMKINYTPSLPISFVPSLYPSFSSSFITLC